MEEDLLCCQKCGGTNVEVKVWADANTDEVLDGTTTGKEDTWCKDCEEHTGLVLQSEFIKEE